ncbi:hypothetical protein D9M68_613890 [compost metagenome]
MFPAKGTTSPVIASGGRNYVADPPGGPTACYNSCQYKSDSGRASSCYLLPGSTTQGFCNYILKGTGENCSGDSYQFAGTGDQLNPPTDPADPAVPPSDPNDPGCPKDWAWSGTTCVKTDPQPPGDGSGNSGDGGSGDSGGSGGNGGGDGSDSGSGSGDGSGSDSGTGDGSGSGSDSGSGSGQGDGDGQCDPATDPNHCQQSGVTGQACDAELQCTGDPVQCAMLKQQKDLRCKLEDLNDFDKHKGEIKQKLQGEDFELGKDKDVDIAGFFTEATGKRFLPSSCPTDKTFSRKTGGGRTFALSYAPLCAFATDFSYLIVVAASLFFALYVGRAFGGD